MEFVPEFSFRLSGRRKLFPHLENSLNKSFYGFQDFDQAFLYVLCLEDVNCESWRLEIDRGEKKMCTFRISSWMAMSGDFLKAFALTFGISVTQNNQGSFSLLKIYIKWKTNDVSFAFVSGPFWKFESYITSTTFYWWIMRRYNNVVHLCQDSIKEET